MKKFGLILGLVSSVLLCTSCVNINNDKLTVAETSRWNGVVLLKYSFDEGGKPFVDDGTYVKWNTQGLSKALYEWYVENGDTRTLANLQVLQSKLNHPRQ